MTPSHRIGVVIVYHDRPHMIGRVLESLGRQDQSIERIVVVDNGSEPPLIASPPVEVERIYPAVGLSAARNIGLRRLDSDLVLLLDDDVCPAPDCLGRLVAAQLDTRAAVICPRIVVEPDDRLIQCDGASIHFAGMLALRNKGARVGHVTSSRFQSTGFIGACMLVDRSRLLQNGGFDEDFYFYLEDLELSYRLAALGHAAWCEPRAVATHYPGVGTPGLSFRGVGPYPPRRAYYTLRHRWLAMLLHYQARTWLVLSPALAVYELAALVECLRRGWLREWIRAAWSLLVGGRSVISRRRKAQHARRIPDRDILSAGALPFATGFASSEAAARAIRLLDLTLNRYWHWIRGIL